MRVWVCVQPLACNRKCLCMCELMQLHARMHFSRACVCFCLKLLVLFVEWSTGAHSDRWCKLLIAVFPVAECGGPCPPSLSLLSPSLAHSLCLSPDPFFLWIRSFSQTSSSFFPSKPLTTFPFYTCSFPLLHSICTCLHLYPSTWAQTELIQGGVFLKFRMDQRWKNFFNRLNPLTH